MDSISNMFPFVVPTDKSIDFLGVMYCSPTLEEDIEGNRLVNDAFIEDFRTRVWLTYRRNFPSLIEKCGLETGITTDAGWGCSVRVTQMLLAQSLISLNFSRDWRLSSASEEELTLYAELMSHFLDSPRALLSIHEIVKAGHSLFNKKPSDWFGPTTGAKAATGIFNSGCAPELGCSVVTFDSGELYRSEVIEALSANPKGVIIFLTHRLGLDSFNEARYKPTIHSLFSCEFFQGLSSGEAMVSAYYMFACCNDFLYYLDPHTVQDAFIDTSDLSRSLPPQPRPLRMRWSRLNPSMNMGFTVRNIGELDALCEYLKKVDPGLFEIADVRRPFENMEFTLTKAEDGLSSETEDDGDDLVIINS